MRLPFPQKLVVIDDDAVVTGIIEKTLKNNSYFSTEIFHSSSKAINSIINNRIRFVITDIGMPEKNGDELIYEFSKLDYHVHSAVITGLDSMTIAYRCHLLGADVFVKPVNPGLIKEIVKRFVDKIVAWNLCVDQIMRNKAEKRLSQAAVKREGPGNKKRKKILLVEDDEQMQKPLVRLLSGDYELELASNGREALEKLAGVDLIITDINMPVMDGFELLEQLGERNEQNIPVLVISGFLSDPFEFQSHQVRGVLHKPFEVDQIHSQIRSCFAP